jgi:c-di-AMP phosphodiesterase-like protein
VSRRALGLRVLIGFGRFWWDFLVGDTPEIFVAVVVILVATTVVSVVAGWTTLAVVLLPLLVISTLSVTVTRAARRHRAGD